MVSQALQRAVGVFSSQREAEAALQDLRASGFDMNRVSVIVRDAQDAGSMGGAEVRDRSGNKADEGAATGAATGGALGALTGLLVGLGAVAIPGVGPVMLAGATATALATTISGGVIGAVGGGLIGALIGLGIPEERARHYSDRLHRGDYLVIVEGSEAEIRQAELTLNRHGLQDWEMYSIPATERTATTAHPATGTVNTTTTGDDLVTVIDHRDPSVL